MNILVTGGTGYIGEFFIPKLIDKKYKVTLLVRNLEKAKKMFGDKVNYIVGDITNADSLNGCCENIDIVYHMVAKVGNDLPSEKIYKEFEEVNVNGTKNMVKEAKKAQVKKFIYVSSIAAMGIVNDEIITESSKCNPYLPYQKTKYEAEQFLLKEYEENKFPVIILRPTKVYGEGEHEYSYLTQIKLCQKGINVIVGMGENFISNVCILDFVQSLELCIENGIYGNVYIISGKDSISAKEITKVISKSFNKKIINIRLPKWLMVSAAFVEERVLLFLKKRVVVTVRNIQAVSQNRIYDLSKSKNELKYEPKLSMEKGLEMMINWYKKENLI